MSTYRAPLADMRFVLFDVLDAGALFARLGFASATPDTVDAVLEEGARFAETVLTSLNAIGDAQGCHNGAARRVSARSSVRCESRTPPRRRAAGRRR